MTTSQILHKLAASTLSATTEDARRIHHAHAEALGLAWRKEPSLIFQFILDSRTGQQQEASAYFDATNEYRQADA